MLRRPLRDAVPLAERARLIERLADPALDARVVKAVAWLRGSAAYDLPRLFLDEIPRRPRIAFVFPLLTLAALAAVALAFVTPVALIALVVIAVLNMWIAALYRPTVHHLLRPIGALGNLLFAARGLSEIGAGLGAAPGQLERAAVRLRWVDTLSR